MKKIIFLIIICLLCIFSACKTIKTVNQSLNDEVKEESGILVSLSKESYWFVPLIEYNEHIDVFNNLRKDNLQVGFNIQYQIDDVFFSFVNGKNETKINFIDGDSIKRELIPARVKYKKLAKASDDSCESNIYTNSFYFQDQLVEYNINSCVYICISIKPLAHK